MIPNKEAVMNIVKHMEDVILIFHFLKFVYFKSARFRELFTLESSPDLLVSGTLDRFPIDCSLTKKYNFFEELS